MVPYHGSTPSDSIATPRPIPPRSATVPPSVQKHRARTSDRSLLSPEDAVYSQSPPRKQSPAFRSLQRDLYATDGTNESAIDSRRGRHKSRHRSRGRRNGKGTWEKLLWVKQSYPDNYTDQDTFLEHLQRNPRLQPYEFWPLVYDSTVIVQHVCSVIIFVVCFVGIFQERISPFSVVGWGSLGTVLGWVLWDMWVAQEEASKVKAEPHVQSDEDDTGTGSTTSLSGKPEDSKSQGLSLPTGCSVEIHRSSNTASHSPSQSVSSINGQGVPNFPATGYYPVHGPGASSFSPRNQQRIATAKSAILIYCALLGLSPILKSLTKSTSKDSIWAMSCWLMIINVFFFDYGGGVGVKFPASLSTNAALMASTVLASRLPSTEHVFSLTLFSIEVFGLFPVFRRHLRHISRRGHFALTVLLVTGAGGGVGVAVTGGGWKQAIVGVVLGNILTGLAMGICSWWLIGLQKYKNEIHGPWDPARPIIRRQWDDY